MDSVSKVIAYSEKDDEALTRHAKKRVQRMMHYDVSLRPFTATIQTPRGKSRPSRMRQNNVSFDFNGYPRTMEQESDCDDNDSQTTTESTSTSLFMCTPKSFPPTPTSRSHVIERTSRFTENVVFLARDQLRVEDGMRSTNVRTAAMSRALRDGSRLAVFDANLTDDDVAAGGGGGGGIALTCGQHIASKVGNALYCSTRSMIPVMRNSYVYWEMTVGPPPSLYDHHHQHNVGANHHHPNYHQHHPYMVDVATLSIGLSTLEMPLHTLVGTTKGSVGLCTTGQILAAGQWLSSSLDDEARANCSYGSDSTVGCLVYLDDRSAFDSWDGVVVAADVTFNVNGVVVPPAVSSGPLGVRPCDAGDQLHPSGTWNDNTGNSNCSSPSSSVPTPPTLSLLVPRIHELFPTVTLHSPATRVMCRFSAEDVLGATRREIGAPEGVAVYSVDGSVLLERDEEED